MTDPYNSIETGFDIPAEAACQLSENGFTILEGCVSADRLSALAAAYDRVVSEADPADISTGSTTTRVHNLVNCGPVFDDLYIYGPVLASCCAVIGGPFKLSSLLARTLNPHSGSQELHVDFARDGEGWPMLGFIVMIDEFREENGATRFLPGSHLWSQERVDLAGDKKSRIEGELAAIGQPGSVVIYNGSVLHGHGKNETSRPRRSIQGAFIRRNAQSWFDQANRMRSETITRIGPLAKYLLNI